MKDSPYVNNEIYDKLKLLNFGYHIPTYTEVFDWIYKKHNLFISIEPMNVDNTVVFSKYTTELEKFDIVLGSKEIGYDNYKSTRDSIYNETLEMILNK